MKVEVQLRNLPDTEAAVGWAGGHTIIADRPEGKAGGLGLGLNGAQILAFAIGGCFATIYVTWQKNFAWNLRKYQ